MDGIRPGQVIAPQGNGGDSPQVPTPTPPPVTPPNPGAPVPQRPDEDPGENPEPVPTPGPEPEDMRTAETAQNQPSFTYTPTQAASAYTPVSSVAPSSNEPLPDDINWTASEFIEHQKSFMWYVALGVGGIAAAVLAYILLKDVLTTAVILFATIVFGIFAGHKPRTQQYGLTHQGVQIGRRMYHFAEFKNFSVATEGAIASIVFMPLKRFMPPLTIYVAPDMEEEVVGFLSEILPFEQHRADAVDSLLRKVRF